MELGAIHKLRHTNFMVIEPSNLDLWLAPLFIIQN